MKTLNLSQAEVDMISGAFALLINDLSIHAADDHDERDEDDDSAPDPEMICAKLTDLAARIRARVRNLTLVEVRIIRLALDYYLAQSASKAYAYRILRNRFPVAP